MGFFPLAFKQFQVFPVSEELSKSVIAFHSTQLLRALHSGLHSSSSLNCSCLGPLPAAKPKGHWWVPGDLPAFLAAFITRNHYLPPLRTLHGFRDSDFSWFSSYLSALPPSPTLPLQGSPGLASLSSWVISSTPMASSSLSMLNLLQPGISSQLQTFSLSPRCFLLLIIQAPHINVFNMNL